MANPQRVPYLVVHHQDIRRLLPGLVIDPVSRPVQDQYVLFGTDNVPARLAQCAFPDLFKDFWFGQFLPCLFRDYEYLAPNGRQAGSDDPLAFHFFTICSVNIAGIRIQFCRSTVTFSKAFDQDRRVSLFAVPYHGPVPVMGTPAMGLKLAVGVPGIADEQVIGIPVLPQQVEDTL